MKIVMDIPEDFYNYLKSKGSPKGTLEYLIIETATPLESFIEGIKAEIEEEHKEENIPYDFHPYSYKEGLDKAMYVIEKHVKTESEEGK